MSYICLIYAYIVLYCVYGCLLVAKLISEMGANLIDVLFDVQNSSS